MDVDGEVGHYLGHLDGSHLQIGLAGSGGTAADRAVHVSSRAVRASAARGPREYSIGIE